MTDDEALNDYPDDVLERFWTFHRANPHVFREFKTRAFEIKATGRTEYSARTIIEGMRWDHDIHTTGEVFKINDDYVPIYARLLIHRYKEFEGFFELREVRSRGRFSDEERRRRDEEDE